MPILVDNIRRTTVFENALNNPTPLQKRAGRVFTNSNNFFDKILNVFFPRNEVTNHRNLRFIPSCVESFIGELSYGSLIDSSGGLSSNSDKKQLVERVANQLIPLAKREFGWEIRLVKSKQVNACALPGGKIIVCEGLLNEIADYLTRHEAEIVSDSADMQTRQKILGEEFESMLAAVIGHEITHADAGHGRSSLQKMVLFYLLLLVLWVTVFVLFLGAKRKAKEKGDHSKVEMLSVLELGANCLYQTMFKVAFNLYMLAQSRKKEYEADEMSMRVYMWQAGYKLNGAVRVFSMFKEMKGSGHTMSKTAHKIQECLATHPKPDDRELRAKKILSELTHSQ